MSRYRAVVVTAMAFVLAGSFGGGDTPGALGGLIELYEWPESPENAVQNPGFEEAERDGKPSGWSAVAPPFSLTEEVAHSKPRSLQLIDSQRAAGSPEVRQELALAPGWYNLRGWIKGEEAGVNKDGSGGRLTVKWGESWATTKPVAGTVDWTKAERLRFAIEPGESATLRIEAYRKPEGKLFFDDIEVRRLMPPPVEGFLLYPNYRGALFADRSQKIRVSVKVHGDDGSKVADKVVRLSMVKEGSDTVVQSTEAVPTAQKFEMALDASSAPLGEYRLRLEVFRKGSPKALGEYPAYRIVKLPPEAREKLGTYVDHDNVLVLGGRRSFVLGLYDTGDYSESAKQYEGRISAIAEAPINLYINYFLGGAPDAALVALMDALQKHGIFYLHTVNTWYADHKRWPRGAKRCRGSKAGDLGLEAYTACMATTIGAHPASAGWYTADEQSADEVERVFGQYRKLRDQDPGGVTFIAQNKTRELPLWRDAADVIDCHKYPIYNVPEGELSPLHRVSEASDAARDAVEGSRPVWSVIQYYQHGSRGHWPTYDELRSMSYMAIVAGAKGLLYWSYGAKGLAWVKDPARKAALWERLVKLTKEIKSLEPALLSPDAPDVLGASSAGSGIRTLSKKVGDIRYVFAVNNTAERVIGEFRLSDQAGPIEVVGEGRSLTTIPGQRFADPFNPYGVHVYRIEKPSAGRGEPGR